MMLQAKNISKSFRFPETVSLFSNLSLSLNRGESIAITGRSGVGKTTLLHILGTLETPDSGEVFIADTLFTAKNSRFLRNQHIGFIFQSFNLLDDFTALENVLMPAKIGRKAAPLEYGMYLLEQVGLTHRSAFCAKTLSGGERQRVAIARALCNDPGLLLADEPSGNLDQASGEAIGTLLMQLVENQGKALALVTHDPILSSLCQKKFLMSDKSFNTI